MPHLSKTSCMPHFDISDCCKARGLGHSQILASLKSKFHEKVYTVIPHRILTRIQMYLDNINEKPFFPKFKQIFLFISLSAIHVVCEMFFLLSGVNKST